MSGPGSKGKLNEKLVHDAENVPFPTGIAIALLVGFLTLIIIYLWSKKKTNRRTILITGVCEAGKTALFSQLVYSKDIETYTSVKQNEGIYSAIGKSPVKIVDIPGHERVRTKFVDSLKPSTRAIIYVVDASSLQKRLKDTTEYLFTLLSDPVIHRSKVPFVLACNKQDLGLAKGSSVIRRELEKEIHLLRETHSRNLQNLDNSSSDNIFLGKEGKPFSFDDLNCKVDICETSAIQGDETGIQSLAKWIEANS